MNLIPIENDKSFYRDPNTGAVINCSDSEYNSYIQHKNSELQKQNELENLKSEVSEIKDMMRLILSKLDSNS